MSPGADMPVTRFVLASSSPARLATLRAAGVEPEVIVSDVDETPFRSATVEGLVHDLARAKAHAVAARLSGDALVLGCDSLLDWNGQPLGKPADAPEAVARWRMMRGTTGVLRTGHCLLQVRDGVIVSEVARDPSAVVHFADVTDAEIDAYVATGEPLQVAGAFTVDGLGGWFVAGVEGDPHTVVGLSPNTLRAMLAELGLSPAELGWPRNDHTVR